MSSGNGDGDIPIAPEIRDHDEGSIEEKILGLAKPEITGDIQALAPEIDLTDTRDEVDEPKNKKPKIEKNRLVILYDKPRHQSIKTQLKRFEEQDWCNTEIVELNDIDSINENYANMVLDYLNICIEYNDEFGENLKKLNEYLHQNSDSDYLTQIKEVGYHINFDPNKKWEDYDEGEKVEYMNFLKTLKNTFGDKVIHCSIINKYEINTVYLTERNDLAKLGEEIQDDIKYWDNLKTFDYGDNCIRFFPGVKFPDSLENINISGSYSIETLTGFKMSNNLQILIACNNAITCIDNIKFPPNLKTLNLMDNRIYFLTYVEFPNNLKQLNLSHNRIDSLKSIEFPQLLESLSLSFNPIDNMKGVKFPDYLKFLDICCIPNDSMTGIKFPDLLISLNLQESMTNTRGLKLPPLLKELNLGSNGVNSINPLKLPNTIEDLYLGHNNIKTLNKVQFPSNLKRLFLGNNLITTLKNVIFPAGLEVLDLEMDPDLEDNDKRINSLKDVMFPSRLLVLKLGYQSIKALESVEFPPSLVHLDLSYNELKIIRNIKFGNNLKVLDLSGNQELTDLDQILIPDSVTELRIPSHLVPDLPASIVERANREELIIKKSLPF